MLLCVWKYIIIFEVFFSQLCFPQFFSILVSCYSVLVPNVASCYCQQNTVGSIKYDDLVLQDKLKLKTSCESSRLPVGNNKRRPRSNGLQLLLSTLSQQHQRSWSRVRDVILSLHTNVINSSNVVLSLWMKPLCVTIQMKAFDSDNVVIFVFNITKWFFPILNLGSLESERANLSQW